MLEGREAYQSRYAIGGPINPRTGQPYGRTSQAFEDWAAAQGRPVVTNDDAELLERLAQSVREHPLACGLLTSGVAEGVVRVEYKGMACQGRLDWLSGERGLVDLKTCDQLTWFEGETRAFGYLHQLAFYRALIHARTGVVVDVHLIAVEKREPFRCGVFAISADVLNAAQAENEQAMERLARCRAEDHWPTGYESLRTIDYL